MRAWRAGVGVVAGAIVLVACVGSSPFEPTGAGSRAGLVVAHRSDPGGDMEAIVAGVVEVDLDRGCVWLSQPDGSRYPVVWPTGTTGGVDESGELVITLPAGQEVRPGDRVEGGGGYVSATGRDGIPEACVQSGEVAVFNARSPITVEPGVGLVADATLVGRVSVPAPIGLELIAVNPNTRSVAVVDFVSGTVHRFRPDDYVGPTDAIDGGSGGGGFVHLWSGDTIWSYPGSLDLEPLVYQPLVGLSGTATSLRVVPAVDGEHTWLVQPGPETTVVELVNLVEVELARLGSFEVEGRWFPVGATTAGLVLVSGDETVLVGRDGSTVAEVSGVALSVGWDGAALLQADGTLLVVGANLGDPVPVEPPAEGVWTGIGGPLIPADAPPIVTGGDRYLVYRADDPEQGELGSGAVVIVDRDGSVSVLTRLEHGSHAATWSRDGEWVAVVEERSITLFPAAGGDPVPLGEVIPPDHWLITAG